MNKFKVGDRVVFDRPHNKNNLIDFVQLGSTGTIYRVYTESLAIIWDIDKSGDKNEIWYADISEISLVEETKNSALPVKIKKLHKDAVVPKYAKSGDAALDLTAVSIDHISEDTVKYDIGLAFEIPEGYVGLIYPRSSICKKDLILSNSTGVVDSGYRGSVQAFFKKTKGMRSNCYAVGDRICQIMIVPYPKVELIEVEELSETERGQGGFGSSGK